MRKPKLTQLTPVKSTEPSGATGLNRRATSVNEVSRARPRWPPARRCDRHPAHVSHPASNLAEFDSTDLGVQFAFDHTGTGAGLPPVSGSPCWGRDCRLIEMRNCSLLNDCSSMYTPRPGWAWAVANCITRLDHFRTWPHAVSIVVLCYICCDAHLRPKTRPTDTAQFRLDWGKPLRRLEIRRTRNKKSAISAYPQPVIAEFPSKTTRKRWSRVADNRAQPDPEVPVQCGRFTRSC